MKRITGRQSEQLPLIRMFMIGESCSGKTSVLMRYLDDSFSHEQPPTIGIDFLSAEAQLNGSSVKIQLFGLLKDI